MWEDTLVYRNPENASQLVSHMTQEQYLDAISCPRIDPIHKGRNIMRPLDADPDDFGLTTDEEKHPPMNKPKDANTRYLIEGVCGDICGKAEVDFERFIKFIKRVLRHNADYAFFKKSHRFHRFFLWRLKKNRAKRGWSLQRLHKRKEAEREKLDRSGQEMPHEPSVKATNRNMEDEEESLSAEDALVLSTEHLKMKRKKHHGSRNKQKDLDEVESAELLQGDLVPAEGRVRDSGLSEISMKDGQGDMESEAGTRKGRRRTSGK